MLCRVEIRPRVGEVEMTPETKKKVANRIMNGFACVMASFMAAMFCYAMTLACGIWLGILITIAAGVLFCVFGWAVENS